MNRTPDSYSVLDYFVRRSLRQPDAAELPSGKLGVTK